MGVPRYLEGPPPTPLNKSQSKDSLDPLGAPSGLKSRSQTPPRLGMLIQSTGAGTWFGIWFNRKAVMDCSFSCL